jgi:hypothetical protein
MAGTMRRNKNEFQLYAELFEAMEGSMNEVDELVRKKEELRRQEREKSLKESGGGDGAGTRIRGIKGSSQ